MTPSTSANPMAIGNATDIPAMAIAAEKRMLAALKIKPPSNALRIFVESACCRSIKKLLPFFPTLKPEIQRMIACTRSVQKR